MIGLRADLSVAINANSKPRFFSKGFSFDPYLTPRANSNPSNNIARKRSVATKTALRKLIPDVQDPRLLNTVLDLQEFALGANLAFQTGRKIPTDLFHETLVSVQYRLLALRGEDDAPQHQMLMHHLLFLGMLAFSATTFLQIKQMPMSHGDLARRMRECVPRLLVRVGEEECSPQEQRLALWFLFVANISVLGSTVEDKTMLVKATRQLVVGLGLAEACWDKVRDILRTVMWIDWLHSEGGKEFWDKVVAGVLSGEAGIVAGLQTPEAHWSS